MKHHVPKDTLGLSSFSTSRDVSTSWLIPESLSLVHANNSHISVTSFTAGGGSIALSSFLFSVRMNEVCKPFGSSSATLWISLRWSVRCPQTWDWQSSQSCVILSHLYRRVDDWNLSRQGVGDKSACTFSYTFSLRVISPLSFVHQIQSLTQKPFMSLSQNQLHLF